MSQWCLFSITLAVSLIMSGCGALFPAHYNETEYRTLADIATTVSLGTCDKATTEKLMMQTTFLGHYTKHLPGNAATNESVVLIQEIVTDLYKRVDENQPISQSFCSLKLEVISHSVDSLKQASGGKIK